MNIPRNIQKLIGEQAFEINTIGMSGSEVICFDNMVLKIQDISQEAHGEIIMTKWLSNKLLVPKILCSENFENKSYMLMSKVQGKMSCDLEYLKTPEKLIEILAEGLSMLWKVDISDCPCNATIDNKLKLAEERVLKNICSIDGVEDDTYGSDGFSSPMELLQWLKDNKPKESYVLSHGDYCLPNIFIKDNKINGFIDWGRGGVGDKYQDIALCYRSLKHNFNGRYGGEVYKDFSPDILFQKLEIEPDWDKIKYYILLDELF